MGENSKIEWTDHTFNPWIGCSKVSAACKNCYAEVETFTRVQRSKGRELWGVDAERHITAEDNWKKPERWNQRAICKGCGYAEVLGSDDCRKCGQEFSADNRERPRVFCASMADIFEDRPDLIDPRQRLFAIIERTPNLDWLVLTKRPENIADNVPVIWFDDGFPSNLWIGATVENQEMADRRIPELLKIPAAVRFLSCEPLLGPIDLSHVVNSAGESYSIQDGVIDWVICGGESGPNARPMDPKWARSLRDQCRAAKVPFHFKQWGEFSPYYESVNTETFRIETSEYFDGHVKRIGKHAAGRVLDGRTWDELPILTA